MALLFDYLRDAGLLEPARLDELSRLPEARAADPTPLAKIVYQRGWLTRYQLNAVAQGKGKDLHVGQYVVLEPLGEGGMGQVYKARHKHMNRVVALKVIRKERLAGPDSVKRFYQEAESAGKLQHANIVLAYDAGPVGASHFLAMEYVEGVDLARLVKEKGRLPYARACDYVRQAALGLAHAHERGMVHRDVKPHNLIVSRAAEGAAGDVVKVMDMGLARLSGADDATGNGVTKDGVVLGTPDYLAPEQARDARKADGRSDLYSLGCTLYFLLTGGPPFRGATLTEVLLKHQMEAPKTLAQRGIDAPPGVQAVLDRLMAKSPDDRYQTPREVLDALAPFGRAGAAAEEAAFTALATRPPAGGETDWAAISGEVYDDRPRPARPAERTAETSGTATRAPAARRGLPLILAGAGAGVLVLAGVVVVLVALVKSPPAKADPETTGQHFAATGDASEKTAPKDDGTKPPETPEVPVVAPPSGPALPRAAGEIRRLADGLGLAHALAVDPRGRFLAAAGSRDATVHVYDAVTGDLVRSLAGHAPAVVGAAYSADGRRLLTAGLDGTARLWDAADGKALTILHSEKSPINAVALSPDSRLALLAHGAPRQENGRTVNDDCVVRVFDTETGREVGRLKGHDAPVRSVAVTPDGKTVATTSDDGACLVWDLAGRELRGKLDLAPAPFGRLLALSADGSRALVGRAALALVSLATLKEYRPFQRPRGASLASCVALSPDGRLALTGHGALRVAGPGRPAEKLDCVVRVWDTETGGETGRLEGHADRVMAVAVLPDGKRGVSFGADGTLRLWDLAKAAPPQVVVKPPVPAKPPTTAPPTTTPDEPFAGHKGEVLAVAFSSDGQRLLSGGSDRTLRLWDAVGGKELKLVGRLSRPVVAVAFAPGNKAVCIDESDLHTVWDLEAGSSEPRFTGTHACRGLSPDGTFYASGNKDVVHLARAAGTGVSQHTITGTWGIPQALAVSPDNALVAFGAADGFIRLGDLSRDKLVPGTLAPPRPKSNAVCLAFSPKNNTLLAALEDHRVLLYSVATGKQLRAFGPHKDMVQCLAFSADGGRVVTGAADGSIRVWDASNGQMLRQFAEHKGAVRGVAFASDGKHGVSCGDGIRMWKLSATP